MSSAIAIGAAELTLSAALIRLSRAKGEVVAAEQAVVAAQKRLEAAKAAPPPEERRCCGLLMTFHGGQWICTAGHD